MWRAFDAERFLGSPIRNLVTILVFMVAVVMLATLGYMLAGWSFTDASYMVLLTIYTVGYGEVRPVDTPYLHAVTVGLMVLGCTGMILLTSALVQFFTVLQLRQIFGASRMQNRIDRLTNHVVICGYGRIGATLARDLSAAGIDFVLIERGDQRLTEATAAGYACLVGDATEEETLIAAGIQRAKVLATVLPDDAANVFITLSARNLSPSIEVIARGEHPSTERKLLRAGAHHVVMPTHIGAERIARMILYPRSEGIATDTHLAKTRRDLETLGLELEEVEAATGATLCGMTIDEAERRAGNIFVVQITRAGTVIPRPGRDERIEAGDRLLIVLRDSWHAARALFTSKAEVRAGRNVF